MWAVKIGPSMPLNPRKLRKTPRVGRKRPPMRVELSLICEIPFVTE